MRNPIRARVAAVGAGALVLTGFGGVGGAVAAHKITTDDIAHQAVTGSKIHKKAIGPGKVRNGSLGGRQLRDGSLGPGKLSPHTWRAITAKSTAGQQGPKGDPGKNGADGKDGVSGYEVVGRTDDARQVDGPATVKTLCASHGEVALAGGARTKGGAEIVGSYPTGVHEVSDPDGDDPAGRWVADGWAVDVAGSGHVQPYVICAQMSTGQK